MEDHLKCHWYITKLELKLKWAKYCILPVDGTVNDVNNNNNNANNIIFTITDSKLYVPVVTLSAKENQKLSTFFS